MSESGPGRAENVRLRRLLTERDERIRKLRKQMKTLRTRLARAEEATAAAEAMAAEAVGPRPPFFIVGQAKSGTSWVMRLLDAHPQIVARGEGRFFGRGYKRPDVKRMNSPTLQPSSLYRAFLDDEYLRAWVERSVWTRDESAEDVLQELVSVSTRQILHRALAGSGKELVGDKTPFLGAEALGELASLTNDARVVHVIRDGRDVAVSAIHHLWNHSLDLGTGFDLTPAEVRIRNQYRANPRRFLNSGKSIFTERRIVALAGFWQANVSRAISDGRSLLDDRYVEVRFEALAREPSAEARRLFKFLAVDADPKVVASCVEHASFERFSGGRAVGVEDSTAFNRKGVAGGWKEVFTERDRRLFVEEAGNLLEELGYPLDG